MLNTLVGNTALVGSYPAGHQDSLGRLLAVPCPINSIRVLWQSPSQSRAGCHLRP